MKIIGCGPPCALCAVRQILILCVVFISILQFHIVCCNYSCRSGIQLSNYNPECGLGCCRQASAQHGPALVWIVYRLQITSSSFYFPAKCFRQFWHRCKCCTFTLKNLWRHFLYLTGILIWWWVDMNMKCLNIKLIKILKVKPPVND